MKRFFLALMVVTMMAACAPFACAEGIEYVEMEGDPITLNGDFCARTVIERKDPEKYSAEGGIRAYYADDMTYYAFFIRWVSENRCDFYVSKYLSGQFMGFMIAEEYEETGKDCFVSVDDAWDASSDRDITLEVKVRDHIATVTMTGATTGYSGTLHFDLTKSAILNGKKTESEPRVLTQGLLKKAIKGSGTYLSFAVDADTYAGNTIQWREEAATEETRQANAVETGFGTFVPGELTAGKFTSEGVTFPYQLYLPKDYDENKTYKLMLFLHGDGSRGQDNTQIVNGSEFILCRRIMDEYSDCIIIAPQTPVSWIFTPNDDKAMPEYPFASTPYQDVRPSKYLLNALRMLDQMKATLPIDEHSIYVSGYSRGAMATWYLLATYPDTFAAAILSCGVGSPDAAETIAKTPVYVFHGDVDDVVSFADDQTLVEAVAKAGGETVFIPCKNYAHSISAPMRADKNVLEWLFSHTK